MGVWDDIDITNLNEGEEEKNEKLQKLLSKSHGRLVAHYMASVNLSGRSLSEETKKKMSKSRTGHVWSPNTHDKLKKSARKRMKPISQFNLDGNWIRDFNGLAEMHDELKLNKRNVQNVCNNWETNSLKGSKECGGFIWKYKN